MTYNKKTPAAMTESNGLHHRAEVTYWRKLAFQLIQLSSQTVKRILVPNS
jgi:hypothetical protein